MFHHGSFTLGIETHVIICFIPLIITNIIDMVLLLLLLLLCHLPPMSGS
jgi:hypothetical protein